MKKIYIEGETDGVFGTSDSQKTKPVLKKRTDIMKQIIIAQSIVIVLLLMFSVHLMNRHNRLYVQYTACMNTIDIFANWKESQVR